MNVRNHLNFLKLFQYFNSIYELNKQLHGLCWAVSVLFRSDHLKKIKWCQITFSVNTN
ncbi:hypothetical protein Hanom_Chr00s000001g01592131 [Helianthus anomalus]